MGTLGSKLLGKKQVKFFQGKDYLTAVSEGEEVVWTNFEQVHEKSHRYEVPPVNTQHLIAEAHPSSHLSSTASTVTAASSSSSATKATGNGTTRKKSILEELLGSSSAAKEEKRRPSGTTILRRPSGNPETPGVSRRPSGDPETSGVNRRPSGNPENATGFLRRPSGTPSPEAMAAGSEAPKEPQRKVSIVVAEPDAVKVVTGADGYQRRKSMARLKREESLARDHVAVVPTLSSQQENVDLSIISLNLLSDFNLTNSVANPTDGRYKHAVDAARWEARLPQLKDLFTKHASTDVFALQEVDFFRFRDDLKPMLEAIGYAGSHQWEEDFAKKGAPSHPFGLATFYKRDKFRETFKEARSRTFILGLSYSHRPLPNGDDASKGEGKAAMMKMKKKQQKKAKGGSADWFVVNVHLEADPKKESKRLAQLSSALFNLSVHTKINPSTARVVVLGDFNSVRDDPPFQWLLANSKAPKVDHSTDREAPQGTYDSDALAEKKTAKKAANDPSNSDTNGNGEDEEEETEEQLAHAFKFADSYGSSTIPPAVQMGSTYADPFADGRVDHLLFTSDTCSVISVLDVPNLTPQVKQFGIFGAEYPSDHYPVGCLLRAVDDAFPAEQEEEEEVDPNICPLTEGQMRVLEFLELGAPKRSGKGKPSPQELAAIKTHTERINAFCSHLNKHQKTWVAKWRKKFKPPVSVAASDSDEPKLQDRFTRSKSVYATPSRMASADIGGLSDLMEGNWMGGDRPNNGQRILNKTVSESQVPSSPSSMESPKRASKPVVKSISKESLGLSSSSSPVVSGDSKRRSTVHGTLKGF